MNSHGQYILPVADLGLGVENGVVDLVGVAAGPPEVGPMPQTELWPVMYDIDDDGRVGFSDFSYFAAAFQHQVDDPGAIYAYAATSIAPAKSPSPTSPTSPPTSNDALPTRPRWPIPPISPPPGGLSATRCGLTCQTPPAAEVARLPTVRSRGRNSCESATQNEPFRRSPSAACSGDPNGDCPHGGAEGTAAAAISSEVILQIVDLPGSLPAARSAAGSSKSMSTPPGTAGLWTRHPGTRLNLALPPGRPVVATPPGPRVQRADLLTAVLHELGHLLGLGHAGEGRVRDDSLPSGRVAAGMMNGCWMSCCKLPWPRDGRLPLWIATTASSTASSPIWPRIEKWFGDNCTGVVDKTRRKHGFWVGLDKLQSLSDDRKKLPSDLCCPGLDWIFAQS